MIQIFDGRLARISSKLYLGLVHKMGLSRRDHTLIPEQVRFLCLCSPLRFWRPVEPYVDKLHFEKL